MFARGFALVVGAFLLLSGIWGLFSPVVWGVFTTNVLHAIIEIVLGMAGIYMGRNGNARAWAMPVSILLLVVGVFWFVPGLSIVPELLNVNLALAVVNIAIGVTGLAAARTRGPGAVMPPDLPYAARDPYTGKEQG